MSNILIVNGAKQFAHSNGELNDTLTEFANAVLGELEHSVKISRADSDYEIQQEIQKYVWADHVRMHQKNMVQVGFFAIKSICCP